MLSGLVSRAVRVERYNALLNAIHVFPFILAVLLLACAALMTHFQNNSTAPPVHRLLERKSHFPEIAVERSLSCSKH